MRDLEKVMQGGFALQGVEHQTEEICLAAVNQDGYALRYVQIQTEEICLISVQQYAYALQFVQPNFFKTAANVIYNKKEKNEGRESNEQFRKSTARRACFKTH